MNAREMTDLALLGISQQGPVPITCIIDALQSLMPELWRPTISVIEGAIRRNLEARKVSIVKTKSAHDALILTKEGEDELESLLKSDAGDLGSTTSYVAEALQFCFLDTANPNTTHFVLSRLEDRAQRRLSEFVGRSQRCPNEGRYTRLWIGLEKRRLEGISRMMILLNRDCSVAENRA
ncbi:MAG: hypothetical protein CFH10_01193 [Alphaproteobacteria bacterium MarineAlpha4_Bin2]|nr:MAG: hypothetical protein CFH10_01193 [Alphaproteobacteria bacterium MarineAlpha4_Bin2]